MACVDVDYRTDIAVAAAIWFQGWNATEATCHATAVFHEVAPYAPGEFYRRELPCLLGVLAKGPRADVVIVDGYVWLDGGRPGLGAHLYEALERQTPVVGIAKTQFAGTAPVVPVLRGRSKSPLFITAAGIDLHEAAKFAKNMHGPYRIPFLVKCVDQLAQTAKRGEISAPGAGNV